MRAENFGISGAGRALVGMLLCALLLAGCGQRLRAEVSAVVEQGYEARGQSYSLAVMPGFAVEDPAAARAALEATLVPALQGMGYVAVAEKQAAPTGTGKALEPGHVTDPGKAAGAGKKGEPLAPDVVVRVWWFSTGPHPVYRTVEWRDRRYWHWRHGYRRQAVVVEDEYARYLVVEGIALGDAALSSASAGTSVGTVDSAAALPETAAAVATGAVDTHMFTSPQEAARALPAAPARLLWRVRVESRGNLARAERVLPSLAAAAAPYMGKSGVVFVVVQEGEVVAAEAMP